MLRYFVRRVLVNGTQSASHPFASREQAERWARIARRDEATAFASVIVRQVGPLDLPRLHAA